MLDILLWAVVIFIIIQLIYGIFLVGQWVIERFILVTIPVVARLIDSIKHPERYQ